MKIKINSQGRDYEVEIAGQGNKVKITIVFSGREMNHTDRGLVLMAEIEKLCAENGAVEKKPSLDGRFMTMVVAPKKPEK